MKIYIIDIIGTKLQDNDQNTIIAEDIILHRDLIRGYSLNYFIMNEYYKFLESVMGKYVSVYFAEFDAPDNLTDTEYEDYALDCHMQLYHSGICLYPSTCPLIQKINIDNGDILLCTEPMMEYSTETTGYENILYDLIYLFDDTIKYIIPMNGDLMINFRQFILDGLPARLMDFYESGDGKYYIDVYSVLKIYISELMFVNEKGGKW